MKLLLGPGPRPGGHRGWAAGGGQGDQAQGAAPQADQQDEAAAGERKIVTPFHHVNVSGIAIIISAANHLIGEVVQSRRRPLLGPSPG